MGALIAAATAVSVVAVAVGVYASRASDPVGATTGGATVAGGNGAGKSASQFNTPMGLALDSAGAVYVADYQNSRVQRWLPGLPGAATVAGTGDGSHGSSLSELDAPNSVAVAADGTVYVADSYNFRIMKWEPGASEGVVFAGGSQSQSGWDHTTFRRVGGIAVDSSERVYVVDQDWNRVLRFDGSSPAGTVVAGDNGASSAATDLSDPIGVAVDASFNVYVADNNNSRVQRWAPGAAEGVTVAGGHGYGNAANQTGGPSAVAVDSQGAVYVAETAGDRVSKWAPGAQAGITVAGTGGKGDGADQLHTPYGVAVDAWGNVFVTDAMNHRVQKWVPGVQGLLLGDLSLPEGPPGMSQTATVTVHLRAPLTFALCVWYSTSAGSASSAPDVAGALDFMPLGTTKPRAKLIAAGARVTKIATKIYGDDAAEGDETFRVVVDRVTATTNGVCANRDAMADLSPIARRPARVTILDDDDADRYYRPAT